MSQACGKEVSHIFAVGTAAIGGACHQNGAVALMAQGFVNGGVEARSVAHGYHDLTFFVIVGGVLGQCRACKGDKKKHAIYNSFQ